MDNCPYKWKDLETSLEAEWINLSTMLDGIAVGYSCFEGMHSHAPTDEGMKHRGREY